MDGGKNILLLIALLLLVTSFSLSTNTVGADNPEETESRFFDFLSELYSSIDDPNLSKDALEQGLEGYFHLKANSEIKEDAKLIIFDLSQASTSRRLYLIDVNSQRLISKCLATHGKNSGKNFAKTFSNKYGSHQTSLGFYKTAEKYFGKHGLSLRLDGLDHSFNSNARYRAIVMHEADYASDEFINKIGRLGRSYGCPALPPGFLNKHIDKFKDGSVLYIYYPQKQFLDNSVFLNSTKYLSFFSD